MLWTGENVVYRQTDYITINVHRSRKKKKKKLPREPDSGKETGVSEGATGIG